MHRIYTSIIQEHFASFRQMVFLSGPRQSGKTTLSKFCVQDKPYQYLNWDNIEHRAKILDGLTKIVSTLRLDIVNSQKPIIILDEIHKYVNWKSYLKGYFDELESDCQFLVTGSAKLNVFRHGGDSMMGRYFLYRIHPLSLAEILERTDLTTETVLPKAIAESDFQNLIQFGGFPEPYLAANQRFAQRWRQLRQDQLFEEDVRATTNIQQIDRLMVLAQLLKYQAGNLTKYSELAKKVRVSEPTIRTWMSVLENLYYHFSVTPWSQNVTRSLLKEPKIYLWDWSMLDDIGARMENLVACHLLKAVHLWTDIGFADYQLHYLRDKEQREVDFLITKNHQPWLLVEVKTSDSGHISPHLLHFNAQLNAPHVLQVAANLPFIDVDCFALTEPKIVPMVTFLSQLV